MLIRRNRNYVGGRQRLQNTFGDVLYNNVQLQKRYSPLHLARVIDAPVLLVHSGENRMVHVEHSRSMAEALDKSDRPYAYVELEDEDGFLSDEASRSKLFVAVDQFLNQYLRR